MLNFFFQVIGSLLYYILSDGHHPFENTYPYKEDPHSVTQNIKDGRFSLCHLRDHFAILAPMIRQMLETDPQKRPTIEDCIKTFKTLIGKPE